MHVALGRSTQGCLALGHLWFWALAYRISILDQARGLVLGLEDLSGLEGLNNLALGLETIGGLKILGMQPLNQEGPNLRWNRTSP